MKTRIAIAIVFFVAGVIALDIYRNNFGLTSKLEKCADEKFAEQMKKRLSPLIAPRSEDPFYLGNPENLKVWLNKPIKEKLNRNSIYQRGYENCEAYAKQYPELFKKQN